MVPIHEVIPNVVAIRQMVSSGREMLADSRESEGFSLDAFAELFDTLVVACHQIEKHIHELNRLLKMERRSTRIFYAVVAGGVAAVTNAIVQLIRLLS